MTKTKSKASTPIDFGSFVPGYTFTPSPSRRARSRKPSRAGAAKQGARRTPPRSSRTTKRARTP